MVDYGAMVTYGMTAAFLMYLLVVLGYVVLIGFTLRFFFDAHKMRKSLEDIADTVKKDKNQAR